MRIPGWTRNKPIPSDLYSYFVPQGPQVTGMWVVAVNGTPLVPPPMKDGFALLKRTWKRGDRVTVLHCVLPSRPVALDSDATANTRIVIISATAPAIVQSNGKYMVRVGGSGQEDLATLEKQLRAKNYSPIRVSSP